MDGATAGDALPDPLRVLLEAGLREAGDRIGLDISRGHAETTFRTEDGHIRWLEARRLKIAVSELERGFDETAPDA